MLRIGIVGVGVMGRQHARVFSNLDNVKLVGVCDLDICTGEEIAKKYNTEFFKDYRELIGKVDAVSIVTPTSTHKEIAEYFIEKKIHVFIEKPITDNSADAEELIKKAKEKNIKLMVGHIERFNPAIKKLKTILTKNKVKINSLMIERIGRFPSRIKNEGIITDLSIHDIDIANYLLEKNPIKVFCLSKNFGLSHFEDSAKIILDYGEQTVNIITNWVSPKKVRKLKLVSDECIFELDYINQELKILYGPKTPKSSEWKDFLYGVEGGEEKKVFVQKEEPLKIELEHFINCIINDEKPLNSGENALKALRIAELCIKSAKTGEILNFL